MKFDGLLVNSQMSTWRASYNPVSFRETVLHKPIYFGQKDLIEYGTGL